MILQFYMFTYFLIYIYIPLILHLDLLVLQIIQQPPWFLQTGYGIIHDRNLACYYQISNPATIWKGINLIWPEQRHKSVFHQFEFVDKSNLETQSPGKPTSIPSVSAGLARPTGPARCLCASRLSVRSPLHNKLCRASLLLKGFKQEEFRYQYGHCLPEQF